MSFKEHTSQSPTNCDENVSKSIVLNVLNETLDKLAILKYINGWSEDEQTTIEYQTIEEQCNVIKNDDVLPPASKECVDLLDFRKDCSFIESTIKSTYKELTSRGTFRKLSEISETFNKLQLEEAEFLEEVGVKEVKYVQLQNSYYEDRERFRKEIHNTMVKIGNLKDEIEDFMQEAAIKNTYLDKWIKSKSEMNDFKLEHKENDASKVINERLHDFEREDRVHFEVGNVYSETEMDLQKQIKMWKLKYKSDCNSYDKKIRCLREAIITQQQKTAEMVAKYLTREEKIEAYKLYKVEQEKKRLDKERKDKAATTIQAWWRGTMVRKGLGKYKKKDKKGKKKKDEKRK